MRSKLLRNFARMHAYDYLRQVIKPLIDKMSQVAQDLTFNIEASRGATETEIKENQKALEFFAENFLNVICTSASAMPL